MASRKSKINLGAPINAPWASEYIELGNRLDKRREDTSNREAKASAVIQSLAETNPNLTDDQMAEIFSRVVAGEDFDVSELPVEEEIPVDIGPIPPSPPVEPQAPEGSLRRGLDELADVFSYANVTRQLTSAGIDLAAARSQLEGVLGGLADTSRMNTEYGYKPPAPDRDALAAQVAESRATIAALTPTAQKLRRSLDQGSLGEATSIVPEAVGSIIGNPVQALPVVGGLAGGAVGGLTSGPAGATAGSIAGATAGALPLAKQAYEGAYFEARDEFGATEEEAQGYAAAITAVEFGSEALGGIGAGAATRVSSALGLRGATKDAIKDQLAKRIRGRVARTTLAATGEGLSEVAANEGSRGVRQALEATDALSSEESREKLGAYNIQQDIDRARSNTVAFAAGFGMGGAIAAPTAQLSYAAELGAQEATTLRRSLDASAAAMQPTADARAAEGEAAALEAARQAFLGSPVPERTDAQAGRPVEPFEDYAQRTADSMPVRQADLPSDAEDFNRMPTRAGKRTQRQREEAGEILATATGKVVPNKDAIAADAERQAAQLQSEQEMQEVLKTEGAAVKREEAAAKAKADREARAAETKRRREAARAILAANPGKSINDPDLARQLRDRLASGAPATAAPTTTAPTNTDLAKKVETVQKRVAAGAKAAESRKLNDRIRRAVKANPDATPEQIAATLADEQVASEDAPLQNDTEITDDNADAIARKAARDAGFNVPDALSMEAPAAEPVTQEFVSKASEIVKNLTRKNTNQTADVQNMLRQGKLVLVPNQQSVGREVTTAAAQYVPEDGKMYLYTDKVDAKDVVGTVMRALHEGTHGGQFNDRQGRPSIYAQMMSKEKNNEASNKIRRAAESGNRVAQAAVAKARAASGDADVQSLELVPYFVSEAVAARGSTLGQLRGLANDVTRAAKSFARKLGADLDISLADIESAAQRVGDEIVQTDVAPQQGDPLDMIAGPLAADFKQAQAEGRTYKGRVDGKERFEVPDNRAELTSNPAMLESLQSRVPVDLELLLDHPALYDQYPGKLENIKVRIDKDLGPGVGGSWDGGSINVSPVYISMAKAGNTEPLRMLLLHETQHAVQQIEGFISGANQNAFINPEIKENFDLSAQRFEGFLKNFEVGLAENSLRPEAKARWGRVMQAAGSPTDLRSKKILFLENGFADEHPNKLIQSAGRRYGEVKERLRVDREAKLTAERAAFRTYLRDYGEGEARNTETRSRMSDDQLELNPPEDTMGLDRSAIGVEEMVDTSPLARSRTSLPSTSAALDMAEETAPAVPREALSTKERVRRIVMSGTRGQTADIKIAEALDGAFRRALRKDYKTTDITPEQQAEILDLLKNVDNANPEAKAEAWAPFKAKYPNVADVLLAARAQIDRRSNEIIEGLMSSGVPLTPEEAKTVLTLIKNKGKYLTRAYNAFQGAAGREWRENRWDNFKNHLETWLDQNSRGRLNKQKAADVEAVYNAVQFFKKKYTIPADEGLMDLPMQELEAMARDYGIMVDRLQYDRSSPLDKREMLVNTLADVRESFTPEQKERMAEQAVAGMLGITPNVPQYAKVMSNLARDPGTLKKKDFVPDELRELLGEMQHPGARILSTLATQAALVARQGVYVDLVKNHNGTLVVPASEITKPGVEEALTKKGRVGRSRGPVQLNGTEYGPLNGWYVHPHVADAIATANDTFTTFAQAWDTFNEDPGKLATMAGSRIGRATGALTRWEKIFGVVYNPARGIANYAGSWLQLASNGNTNLGSVAKGHRTAADYVASSVSGGTTQLVNDAYRYVNLEAADIGEIQHILGNSIEDYMDGKIGNDAIHNKIKDAFAKPVHAMHKAATSSYAVADNWTKIANFYDRLNTMKTYYDIVDPDRSIEDIKQEAGNTTNYTNISYERVPKGLKAFESVGLTKFVPYFYEAYRTRFTNYNQAILDLKRAAATEQPRAKAILRNAAMKRLIGNTLATAGMPAVGFLRHPALHTAVGFGLLAAAGDDEDHKLLRRMVGDFARDQDLINFGVDENGDPVFLSASDYFDPFGPANDLLRLFINEPEENLPNAVASKIIDMVITPSWIKNSLKLVAGKQLPESTLNAVVPDMVQALQEDLSQLGVNEAALNNTLKFLEGWVPGIVKAQAPYSKPNIANPKPIQFGGVTVPGVSNTAELAANMNKAGFRFETLNPARQMSQYGRESSDQKTKNRQWLNQNLSVSRNLTQERFDSIVAQYAVKELDRLEEDYQNVRSLRKWGYPDAAIDKFLKDGKWGEEERAMLLSDQIAPILSMKSLKDRAALRVVGMPPEEKKDYVERVAKALDKIESNKTRLEEMGMIVKER